MYHNGFLRVAAVSPEVFVANPDKNLKEMIRVLKDIKADLVVFPELSITGYTCEDLFYHTSVTVKAKEAIESFLETNDFEGVVVIGAPIEHKGMLYNCALAIQKDKVLGIVPKMFLPHTGEFYEKRWFADGVGASLEMPFLGQTVPFGPIVFNSKNYSFGIEVCADMWGPLNPSAELFLSGAQVVVNISGSPEVVMKDRLRRELINSTTYRHKGAYVYVSSGITESTSAVLFGGDKFVSEIGTTIGSMQNYSFEEEVLYSDIDIDYINHVRRSNGWFKDARKRHPMHVFEVPFKSITEEFELNRIMDRTPFVPKTDIDEYFKQVTLIQTRALMRRLKAIGTKKTLIGVSGGLDSALALLQIVKAYKDFNYDLKDITAISMPSYPTSDRTKNNAKLLCTSLGVTFREIPITDLVDLQLKTLNHEELDVTYENVQARTRTSILLNLSNKQGGIVIGTGDMTEMALGWCTFAGDQIAHYGLNSGIPKTLIRFMVSHYAKVLPELGEVLIDIVDTPISPELLVDQVTEKTIGSYEVNDLIMYRFLKYGDSMERIKALIPEHSEVVTSFFKRFYASQFKRASMPDGPKVIFTTLNSHSDFRMASDIVKWKK